jgi:nucleoside phosphorylase
MILENPRLAKKFQHQGFSNDQLFKPSAVHVNKKKSCKACRSSLDINLVKRKERSNTSPVLHYRTIGSADQVMKDSTLRDEWARKENIICFEMEAAGKF